MAKFKGNRCIPTAEGKWDKTKEYLGLSVVLDEKTGDSYTSKKVVPAGTELTNKDYWALSGQYNAQMALIKLQLEAMQNIPEGGTTADAALENIRIGADGTEYATPGDAVRGQVGALSEEIDEFKNDTFEKYFSKIDVLTENFTHIDNVYVNSDFSIVSSNAYDTYFYYADDVIVIYFDKSVVDNLPVFYAIVVKNADVNYIHTDTKFNGTFKEKITKDKMPTLDNPYILNKGEILILVNTYGKPIFLNWNYKNYKLIPRVVEKSGVILEKNIIVEKISDEINIFVPLKNSDCFMRYQYLLVEDASINMHQWRIKIIEIVNSSMDSIVPIGINCEWEGVVKEKGTSDFIGGYHGNETNEFISLFIDGKEMNMDTDFEVTSHIDVQIVNKSTINRCDTVGDDLFTRYKISRFNKDNYIVENRWIALQDVILNKTYMSMLSLPIVSNNKNIGQYSRYNDGYAAQPSVGVVVENSDLYPSNYANTFEIWGDSGFYAKCESIPDYDSFPTKPNHVCIADRSQTNTIKGYHGYLTTDVNIPKGRELRAKTVFTFMLTD